MFKAELNRADVAALQKKLRALPDRADKDMRKEFRALAKEFVPQARSAAEASRPIRLTPKHPGAYRWRDVVMSIKSGADGDSPFIAFGSSRAPGWPGWEFGSNRKPQFPPRNKSGRFFQPNVRSLAKEAEPRVEAVFNKYAAREFD